jgi:hypothetical protein
MKSLFYYLESFQRNEKIMTNSIIVTFPLLLPFPAAGLRQKKPLDAGEGSGLGSP